MSLELIQKGKQRRPPRVVVYGPEGIGKSSFGSGCPDPVFIQTEDGLGEIDCESFPLATSYNEVMGHLGTLCESEHSYKTLVVDTLDWFEKLAWAQVASRFKKSSIEDIGYAKGYTFVMDEWKELVSALDYLRNEKGMIVVLLAHAKVERFDDPENAAYDRYTLRLHKLADAYIREWSDAVLFATRRVRVQTEDTGFNRTRNIAKPIGADGGERVLRTVGGPACTAKNRYGIVGEIELSWAAFAKAAGF